MSLTHEPSSEPGAFGIDDSELTERDRVCGLGMGIGVRVVEGVGFRVEGLG